MISSEVFSHGDGASYAPVRLFVYPIVLLEARGMCVYVAAMVKPANYIANFDADDEWVDGCKCLKLNMNI